MRRSSDSDDIVTVLARVHCQAQLRVLGMLYIGCETIWYHSLDGEQSRARILHVQVMTMPMLLPIALSLSMSHGSHCSFSV